jgi:hypothetical protein
MGHPRRVPRSGVFSVPTTVVRYEKAEHPSRRSVPWPKRGFLSLLLGLILLGGLLMVACRQRGLGGEQPEASLAESPQAQTAFRSLESDWNAATPGHRARLEPKLRAYLGSHGNDPRAQVVRVYLGWVLIERGRLAEASEVLAPVREGPAGTTRDFAQVADAAILLGRGQPERALSLVRILDGKVIDPAERLVVAEVHVRAAIEARRWHEATEAMVDWAADAPPDASERVARAIEGRLPQIQLRSLERSLDELQRASPADGPAAPRAAARVWLARAVRAHLGAEAVKRADAALARRLLATAPASTRKTELGQELARLSAGVTARPQVAGRAFGLVLSVGSAELRRRAAAVAAGVARALDLLEPARGASRVQLITRDEAGTEQAMSEALTALAGDGAVILAAGLDRQTSELARAHAARVHIPMLLFFPPTRIDKSGLEHSFVLGADPEAAREFLTTELTKRGARRVLAIGGDGAPCAAEPAARRESTDALLVLGSADCTRELALGMPRMRLGLGLETSELCDELGIDPPPLAVGAGRFPRIRPEAPPGWFEALGHDAAELVEAALGGFPTERVDDARSVAELHRRAEAALLGVQADLWTTEQRGFGGTHQLARTWTVVTGTTSGSKARSR